MIILNDGKIKKGMDHDFVDGDTAWKLLMLEIADELEWLEQHELA